MGRSKDFQRSRQNKRRKTGESKIKSKEISPKPGGKARRLGGISTKCGGNFGKKSGEISDMIQARCGNLKKKTCLKVEENPEKSLETKGK
jgi:hypothetical protein